MTITTTQNPKFRPWKGPNFPPAPGPRVLIVGESRYYEDPCDRLIIGQGGARTGETSNTWTKFTEAMIRLRKGEKGYEADRTALWDSVVFHNYIQTWFPGEYRERVPLAVRRDPINAGELDKLLRDYKPSHAIVWGIENWREWARLFAEEYGTPIRPGLRTPGKQTDHLYCYCTVSGSEFDTLFTWVYHPSHPKFVPERFAPILEAFLAMPVKRAVTGATPAQLTSSGMLIPQTV